MAGPSVGLHNFSKGQLSEELWGRVDIAPYGAAARIAQNVYILKYGGLSKRPGSRLVYEIKDGEQRLIPFEGAYEASYVMVMGQATMRLAAEGGMVLEQLLTVEGATQTDPVELTVSYHGLTTGDEVFFDQVEGMVELNRQVLPVTVTGTHTFTVPLDGTGFGAFTGDEGGVIRADPPAPPPPPPPVPDPVPPPPPPPVGGGGGGIRDGGGGGWSYEN